MFIYAVGMNACCVSVWMSDYDQEGVSCVFLCRALTATFCRETALK